MEHQDWKTYIIHCKNSNISNKEKNVNGKKKNNMDEINKQNKIEKKIETGNLKHEKIDLELSKQIQNARLSKNWTQKQLANKLSIPICEINEMETGRFKYNGQKISKVKRFLKIK
tara:strand:- start:369 stop:713 length:345 start_codon:yes stop_codon:yes gene_type:complete